MTHPDELPDSAIWEASGGVRIPLKDMGETHLRNATRHMRKALAEAEISDEYDGPAYRDEDNIDDITEKLLKLEGETERRLNNKPSGPKSLPITKARQEAEDTYQRMIRRD